jgi:hypothetical protein
LASGESTLPGKAGLGADAMFMGLLLTRRAGTVQPWFHPFRSMACCPARCARP